MKCKKLAAQHAARPNQGMAAAGIAAGDAARTVRRLMEGLVSLQAIKPVPIEAALSLLGGALSLVPEIDVEALTFVLEAALDGSSIEVLLPNPLLLGSRDANAEPIGKNNAREGFCRDASCECAPSFQLHTRHQRPLTRSPHLLQRASTGWHGAKQRQRVGGLVLRTVGSNLVSPHDGETSNAGELSVNAKYRIHLQDRLLLPSAQELGSFSP